MRNCKGVLKHSAVFGPTELERNGKRNGEQRTRHVLDYFAAGADHLLLPLRDEAKRVNTAFERFHSYLRQGFRDCWIDPGGEVERYLALL